MPQQAFSPGQGKIGIIQWQGEEERWQENILKKRLGTSVTIKQGRNKKGKIEIEFKDNDEFERIISLFKDE